MQRTAILRRLVGLLFLGPAVTSFQAQTEHQGRLEPDLVPSNRSVLLRAQVATDEQVAGLDVPAAEGAEILVTAVRRPGGPQGEEIQLVFVEPPDGAPAVWVDADLDGTLEPQERFELSPSDHPRRAQAVIVHFSLAHGRYPLRFAVPRGSLPPLGPDQRFLEQSAEAKAVGRIALDGRTAQVEMPYDAETGSIPLTRGYFAVDGDGDGVISENILTPERAIADDEQVVFRLGSRYVSFESADRASGVFTMRTHPRADYARIELVVGQQMTDFRFRNFEGRERRLSDFRGKFLLLDFWGTWCGPCVRAIPDLKAAYEKFRERGFEILGVDHRDEFEEVRAFVAERGMDWPEVRPEDGDSLVRERFRIIAYPTYVLLDPEGTIVFVGHALQGTLLQTLEEALPPEQARGTVTVTTVG